FAPAAKRLAIIYADQGEDQKAYELASRTRQVLPDDAEVARTLGIVLYRRGGTENYRNAALLLDESLRKGDENGRAMYYLGMAHYQLKQPKQCKNALQRALALNIQPKLAED